MKSISHLSSENDPKFVISKFLRLIGLASLSRKVNFKRKSSITLIEIISWLMAAHFDRRSMHRAQASPRFSTRTVRNVLNDGRINWQKLLCLIASQLIHILAPFIDRRRRLALIIDDTLMNRQYSSKTELLARTFDHDRQQYCLGYRGLTLGWSDGNTFLPVNFALMSTQKTRNLLGRPAQITDQRKIAGQRRCQAQKPMNQVALELINQAIRLGVKASYVLFDSWYSSPKMFWQLQAMKLHGIGMIKKSSKIYYRYRGRHLSIKGLYQRLAASKMKRRNHYLYSSVVIAHFNGHDFPLKVVFVSKRGSKGNYLVLATTQLGLRPEEIIQLYGRRWQIETYFKAAKQYLMLNRSQIQNYDGQCGYVAVTAITYDLLSWQERLTKDDRTIGGLFYIMNEALPDIKFMDALVYLISTLSCLRMEISDQINQLLKHFMAQLPVNIQNVLQEAA